MHACDGLLLAAMVVVALVGGVSLSPVVGIPLALFSLAMTVAALLVLRRKP